MTKKEKIAWAMARVLDDSHIGGDYIIETHYNDCDHCGALETKEEETISSDDIDILYSAYQSAKELDKGK